MDCLYHMHNTTDKEKQDSETSWVSGWLRRYAQSSLTKFEKLGVPIDGSSKEKDNLEIMFDKEKDLSNVDKLSQVPVLFFLSPLCVPVIQLISVRYIVIRSVSLVCQLIGQMAWYSFSQFTYQSISLLVHQSVS